MWIQTGVRVRKRLSWVLTSVTLTFDLWPWPFAWTSLMSILITAENFMMIWWWEHVEKGVADRRTDRRTDWTSPIAAWSQLKLDNLNEENYRPVSVLTDLSKLFEKKFRVYNFRHILNLYSRNFCPVLDILLAAKLFCWKLLKTGNIVLALVKWHNKGSSKQGFRQFAPWTAHC